jgi:hypothetical protein
MFFIKKQPVVHIYTAQAATYLIALSMLLAACSPALNWREVRPDTADVRALLPCKPDHAAREVQLAGASHSMEMLGCEAAGATFTVAVLSVAPEQAARVKAALQAGDKATHSHYQTHGGVVVQAAIYGTPQAQRDGPSALSSQAVETFFGSVQLVQAPARASSGASASANSSPSAQQ